MLKAWIDAGASGPQGEPPDRLALVVPKIASQAKVRPVTALDASRDGKWLAVARYGSVALHRPRAMRPSRSTSPAQSWTTSPARSRPSTSRRTAPGWSRPRASPAWAAWRRSGTSTTGRRSASSRATATCSTTPSSRPTARRWPPAATTRRSSSGTPRPAASLRTLAGHNGAVYDVAFSPDGRFLVSASADDTCKVWRVADGAADGHAAPAAQGGVLLRLQPRRPLDRRRRRRQHDPRLGVRLARQAARSTRWSWRGSPTRARSCGWRSPPTARGWSRSPRTGPSRSGRPPTTPNCRLWERQPDVATRPGRRGRRHVVPRRPDGRLARRAYPIPAARASGASDRPAEAPAGGRARCAIGATTNAVAEREPNDAAGAGDRR